MACFYGFFDDTGWRSDVRRQTSEQMWVTCHQPGGAGQCFIVAPTLCLCWILKVNGALKWVVASIHLILILVCAYIYMHNWANSSKLTSYYCIQMICTNKQRKKSLLCNKAMVLFTPRPYNDGDKNKSSSFISEGREICQPRNLRNMTFALRFIAFGWLLNRLE